MELLFCLYHLPAHGAPLAVLAGGGAAPDGVSRLVVGVWVDGGAWWGRGEDGALGEAGRRGHVAAEARHLEGALPAERQEVAEVLVLGRGWVSVGVAQGRRAVVRQAVSRGPLPMYAATLPVRPERVHDL